jgi:ribonuclease R
MKGLLIFMSDSSKKTKEQRYHDSIKKEIFEYFEVNDEKSFSVNQVIKAFAVRDREMKVLVGHLTEKLHKERLLIKHENGTYQLDNQEDYVEGTVDHVNPRFAFIRVEGRADDIYIDAKNLKGAIDGDMVKVQIWAASRRSKNMEGEVLQILQRRNDEIVGTIQLTNFHGFVMPDSKKIYEDIYIPKGYQGSAEDGDKVIVKIKSWPIGGKKAEARVIEVLGKAGENNTEMHAILAEFGLPYKFEEVIDNEANAISTTISATEIKKRKDFRKITTITIDPADAKDFDDAISIQFLENGNTEVGVHIADVTHYVQPNTNLEKEAANRATSVYLVDRTIPMLPEKLSNNLCSLRPNEDKLTFSAVFELDENAKIINEWFGRTVIHSDKRFAYEEAQTVLDGSFDSTQETKEAFQKELITLNTLAKKLRKARFAAGSVNFETVEVKFVLDENGKPLGITPKIRKDAHKLIEEFMLLANKKVAEFVFNKKKEEPRNTMIYRVHEPPNPDKLLTFSKFAAKFGYKVDPNNVSSTLNHLMETVDGKPEQNVMESLAVRTMAKARYSTQPIGHFGLAFPFYSHFTSPIRRYPDMMAHRLLQYYLDGGEPVSPESWEAKCKYSSDRERLANEAERASIKYKQVEFMSLQEDREFEGIISGVTEFGIFVEITETACEGLVRMIDLTSDYFEHDADNFRLVGKSTGKVYTFGDKVTVKVKECNISRRSMDLTLLNQGPNHRDKAVLHHNKREQFGRGAKIPSKAQRKGIDGGRRRR